MSEEKNLDQEVEKIETGQRYLSPTLNQLSATNSKLLPKQVSACQVCPNAIWFVTCPKTLTCYCMAMKLVVWTTKDQTIIQHCDGMYLGQDD